MLQCFGGTVISESRLLRRPERVVMNRLRNLISNKATLKLYKAWRLFYHILLIVVPYGIFVRPAIRERLKGGLGLYTVTAVLHILFF